MSFAFGLLGFLGSFYTVAVSFNNLQIRPVWNLVFPLLIALAWGNRYAFISIFGGLTIFCPFLIFPDHGILCAATALSPLLWIFLHGWGQKSRRRSKRLWNTVYFIQLIYILLCTLLYFLVCCAAAGPGPVPWHAVPYAQIRLYPFFAFAVGQVFCDTVLLAIADLLLLLPVVRKLFRLKAVCRSQISSAVPIDVVLIGLFIAFLLLTGSYEAAGPGYPTPWEFDPAKKTVVTLFHACLLLAGAAGVRIRFTGPEPDASQPILSSNYEFGQLFRNLSDLYYVINGEGNILALSPSIQKILGYHPDELMGRSIEKLYADPEDRKAVNALLEKNGSLSGYEVILKDKDGKKRSFSLDENCYICRFGRKKILGLAKDLSGHRLLQAETGRQAKALDLQLQAIINSTDDIIWSVDKDRRIIFSNHSFQRFFRRNYGIQITPRLAPKDLLPADYAEKWHRFYQAAEEEGRFQTLLATRRGNRLYEITISAVYENHTLTGFTVYGKDITDYVLCQEQLTKLKDDLEQNFAEKTQELKHAMEELESFASVASHDLKAPLRAFGGYLEIIREDYGGALPDEVNEMLGQMQDINDNMMGMISNLLKFCHNSKAPLFKEKTDMKELFGEASKEILIANKDRHITIRCDNELPVVTADKMMMKQVVQNALTNAVKFTKTRKKAIIKAGCNTEEGEYIFYIKDNGIGFDMQFSNKLFAMFQRLHSSDEFEGSGIGLATIHKIIMRHGGRTWIVGEPDKGATIYFTLPIE